MQCQVIFLSISIYTILQSTFSAKHNRVLHHPSSEFYSSTGPPEEGVDENEGSGETVEFSSMPSTRSLKTFLRTSTTTRPVISSTRIPKSTTSTRRSSTDKKTRKTTVTPKHVTDAITDMVTSMTSQVLEVTTTAEMDTSTISTIPSTSRPRSSPITIRITKFPDYTTTPWSLDDHDLETSTSIPIVTESVTSTDIQTSQILPSPEPHAFAVLCNDIYQHCLLSQTSRFGVDPIGPYFVDEILLPQFCKQHDEIVQPCLAKSLQIDKWESALENCAMATQQDDQASATTAYMMIRAARTWQFLCQLHKLHQRNDTVCFREKLTQCVLNMDMNFLEKCQTPCGQSVNEETQLQTTVLNSNHFDQQSYFGNTNDSENARDLDELKITNTADANSFLPWNDNPRKFAGHKGSSDMDVMKSQENDGQEDISEDHGHEIWYNGSARNFWNTRLLMCMSLIILTIVL